MIWNLYLSGIYTKQIIFSMPYFEEYELFTVSKNKAGKC